MQSQYTYFFRNQFVSASPPVAVDIPSLFPHRILSRCGRLGVPTPRATLEHVAVMEDTVGHGRHRRRITQQLSPVLHRPVGSEHRAGGFPAGSNAAKPPGPAIFASLAALRETFATKEKTPGKPGGFLV